MNEIEKMYKNANIALKRCSECDNDMDCDYGKGCYPLFTAEKQLELIKWLLDSICLLNLGRLQFSENFKNDLAGLINKLWADISDEEKQQIKEILE